MKKLQGIFNRAVAGVLIAAMAAAYLPTLPATVAHADESGTLTQVTQAQADANVVTVTFNDGIVGKITFLENDIFRYNVDPSGQFSPYGNTNNAVDTAKIPQYPDSSDAYSHPDAQVKEEGGNFVITSGDTTISFEKDTAKMTVSYKGNVVMEESKSLELGSNTVQTLVQNPEENYYGGGTQNGRFVHTGQVINIANESNWVDGGVASPNPFYYSTSGYGILRNTFKRGSYDFGSTAPGTVTASHNENEYDAYIFLSGGENSAQVVREILGGYYHVTGNPVLLPQYAFYEGHLNCYNRDSWTDTTETDNPTGWVIKGSASASGNDPDVEIASAYKEAGMSTGYVLPEGTNAETLNGTQPTTSLDKYPTVNTDYKFSASAVIDQYQKYDMPLGYFLPNDGYGCGYGQNGYYTTGGVNPDGSSSEERTAAIDANVQNLNAFTLYAQSKGVETGLWTQSNLSPDSNANTSWHLLRDFRKEVTVGGITTLKTDVAWVGHGYNFALNGLKTAYDIVTDEVSYRPNIITLDGWAGTQRYGAIWTGDQVGGNWEYIRFHVPTYIGQSLSGNPNIGSDMDGIFGGNQIIAVRDTQWKIFTPLMLNMDGWGSFAKTPQTFGDPYTGISRMYLKLKAQLMPYLYTGAASAANIDTGNDDTGMPMIRAMFLEYPEDSYANTKAMQYQFMYGPSILVAPVYSENSMDDVGNDVRNDIYLPDEDQIWIDYFTGEQYHGGQTLNNFDAPIWKLPVFVKNGAIIPMWEENNSPSLVDRTQRLVEFWPAGSTEYTLYEDDGKTANAEIEEVEGYGTTNTVTYGDHVSTTFTSTVTNGTAVLTAEKSTGTYEGYDQNKDTTFIVNVSKEPSSVTAQNGSTSLNMVEVGSKEEVLNADVAEGTFVYFYDAAPAIEAYTVEVEDEFIEMMEGQTSSPKLYVKFASTDTQTNAQTLTLVGFENVDPNLAANELNPDLAAPTGLADVEADKTPTSNTLTWNAVEGATGYQMEIDGIVNAVGSETTFVHGNQVYNSTHTYQVRAVNAQGYSEWSEEITATTAQDPWRNVPAPVNVTWTGGDSWGAVGNAFDHNYGNMFHSTNGDVVANQTPLILDYGKAYELDQLVYVARTDNYGNGAVQQMDVYTSLDGVHWTLQWDGSEKGDWSYNASLPIEANFKTVPLTGAARYVKLVVTKSSGGFFSAAEISVYKKDGTSAFAVGSTNKLLEVGEADYTNMKNYLGVSGASAEDGKTFQDQVGSRYGDINGNNIYEIYDYAYTMFNLDGGTRQTGSVSGNMLLLPSADTLNTGEILTIEVYGDKVANLNAFGGVLNYDESKLEFVSVSGASALAQMENLSVKKVYSNVESYVNLAFANRGDKPLYTGSGVVATITMKALADGVVVADAMDLSSVTLMGPGFDTLVCENQEEPQIPGIVGGEDQPYRYNEDFTLTMTNEFLTTDDGTNVKKLIQQNSYDSLFNGNTDPSDRGFEFKYEGIEENQEKALPKEVTLPLTLHLTMKEGKAIDSVDLYNANKGNGYLSQASALFRYADGSTAEVATITADNTDNYAFRFANPDQTGKQVTGVDLVLKEAINGSGTSVNNMLTLAELEVKSGETKLGYGTDFTVTMTNDFLTADDGSNVNKLIQQNSYYGLFNGDPGRDFEFKWDIESNWVPTGELPDYVTVPLTLHVNMNQPGPVKTVNLYNSYETSNGYVTRANAQFRYEDGTTASVPNITAGGNGFKFAFANPDETGKKVVGVDLNLENCSPDNKVLTLSELEVLYASQVVKVEGISPAETNVKEMYVGNLADIQAVFTPENVTNPYFTVESDNARVVKTITLADENNLPTYKAYAVGAGTAQIILKAVEDPSITASYTITVKPGVDKTELTEVLAQMGNANSDFYTPESYAPYKAAVDAAYAVLADEEATRDQVSDAANAVRDTYGKLVETAVPPLDTSAFTSEALYSESNTPDRLFDGDLATYWESPYLGENAKLPQELVVSLGKTMILDKIELLSHTAQNGGVVEFQVWAKSGQEEWTQLGQYSVERSQYLEGRNVVVGARFAAVSTDTIKIVITKSVGRIATEDDMYARIAEMRIYGDQRIQDSVRNELVSLTEERLDQNKYTTESWNAYAAELEKATALLEDPNGTQEDYGNTITALKTARNALVLKNQNPDQGQGQGDKEDSRPVQTAPPTASSAPEQSAVPARRPTQPTVTAGRTVDKDALEALINANIERDKADYTSESWASFAQALEKAQLTLQNGNANQTDVNQCLKELEAAVAGLMTPQEEAEAGLNPAPETSPEVTEESSGQQVNILPILGFALLAVIIIAAVVFLKAKKD